MKLTDKQANYLKKHWLDFGPVRGVAGKHKGVTLSAYVKNCWASGRASPDMLGHVRSTAVQLVSKGLLKPVHERLKERVRLYELTDGGQRYCEVTWPDDWWALMRVYNETHPGTYDLDIPTSTQCKILSARDADRIHPGS
jgi:hypothetical protein